MDGTLFKNDSTVSPRTKKAIRNWLDAGLLFVPCTGRPLCGLDEISSLFEEDLPFIVHHGAMAVMHRSKKQLFSVEMEADHVIEIYRLAQERKQPMAIFCKEKLYFNMECEPLQAYAKAVNTTGTVVNQQNLEQLAQDGVINIIWMDYPENIPQIQKEMQVHFGGSLNCHGSGKYLFEFVAKEATKANGLMKLGKKLGVKQEEIVAIGDGYNDISMLKYAGYSIAMGNAHDEVKAVSDHVTLSNDEDGVAVWMEGYLG